MGPGKILFAAILFLSAGTPLFASTVIKGDVKKVSAEGKNFSVTNQETKQEAEIYLSVETKFVGLSSLLELVPGDEVAVTAQKNAVSGHWEADSVTVSKMVIRHPKSDTAALEADGSKSASVASLENETKIRTRKEIALFLEQFDRELDSIKKDLRSKETKKKYKKLTKGLWSDKRAVRKKLKNLDKASDKNWPRAKQEAEAAVQVLRGRLENLKAQTNFNTELTPASEVVIPSFAPAPSN